jgi:hypothetical protein
MGGRASPRHGPRGWVRLERRYISQPLGGRPRDHSHALEWPTVLRARSRKRNCERWSNKGRVEPQSEKGAWTWAACGATAAPAGSCQDGGDFAMTRRTHSRPANSGAGSAKLRALRCAIYTRVSTDQGLEQDFISPALAGTHRSAHARAAAEMHSTPSCPAAPRPPSSAIPDLLRCAAPAAVHS